MTLIRQALYAVWFFVSIAIVGIIGLPFGFASRRGAISVMKVWCKSQAFGIRWLCGVRSEFRGLENIPKTGGCLIAMKHQSTFDVIAPFIFLDDPAFTPKAEIGELPIFGFYVRRSGMILLDRDGGAKTMRTLLTSAKAAAVAGRQVLIFPEGTRQKVGAEPDYKPGVAGIYRTLNVPCIPVAVNTGVAWPGSIFPTHPGRIICEALAPIEPGLDRGAFMARLQEAIEPATEKLVAEATDGQSSRT